MRYLLATLALAALLLGSSGAYAQAREGNRIRLGISLNDDSGPALGLDTPAGRPFLTTLAQQTATVDILTGGDTSVALSLMQWTQPVSRPTTGLYYGIGPALVAGDGGGLGLKLAAGQTIAAGIDVEAALFLKDDSALMVSAGFRF